MPFSECVERASQKRHTVTTTARVVRTITDIFKRATSGWKLHFVICGDGKYVGKPTAIGNRRGELPTSFREVPASHRPKP
jgi:hypothetical protein